MRSRRGAGVTGVTMFEVTLIVVLLAGIVAGCGSDERAARNGTTEETTPSWNGDLEREQLLDRQAEMEEAALEGAPAAEDCRAVGAAFFFVLSYGAHRFQLTDDADRAEWDAEAEARVSAVPPDLRDELEVMRATAEAYARKMAGLGLEGLLDPARQPERDDAQAMLAAPGMEVAANTVGAFLHRCPLL